MFAALLSSCSLGAGITDMNVFKNKIPQEAQLKVLYDVYLPTVTYKKSNPPCPSKRVVVIRYDILLMHCLFHDHILIVQLYLGVCVFTQLYHKGKELRPYSFVSLSTVIQPGFKLLNIPIMDHFNINVFSDSIFLYSKLYFI